MKTEDSKLETSHSANCEEEKNVQRFNSTVDAKSETKSSTENIPFIITNLDDSEEKPYDYEAQIITTSEEDPDMETEVTCNGKVAQELQRPEKERTLQKQVEEQRKKSSPTSSKKKKKSHKRFWWKCSSVCLIMIALSAVGWNFYSEIKAAERQEQLDLAVLCKENYNIEDYQNFLKKYSQSEHCRNVRQRLNELKTMAEDWKSIEFSHNENSFVEFKNKYNDPYYSRLCNQKLDSIDWEAAKLANTPDTYQRYINRHPNGIYISDAIIAKSKVAYMNISEQEQNDIAQLCSHFFTAIGVNNKALIQEFLATNVTQFMGLTNPELDDIFEWTSKNKEKYNFVNYFIHDDLKISKEINEYNEEFFKLAFTIDQITTNETGEESTILYNATMMMNKNHQISSLVFSQI